MRTLCCGLLPLPPNSDGEAPIRNSPGGMSASFMPIELVSATGTPRGFAQACDDLRITQRFVVYPGSEKFALRHGTQAIGLAELAGLLHAESKVQAS